MDSFNCGNVPLHLNDLPLVKQISKLEEYAQIEMRNCRFSEEEGDIEGARLFRWLVSHYLREARERREKLASVGMGI